MIKDYFIEKIENAIEKAIKAGKLGAMTEYNRGSLAVERPKNADFGDYAVNVSSLARFARIAPRRLADLCWCRHHIIYVASASRVPLSTSLLFRGLCLPAHVCCLGCS